MRKRDNPHHDQITELIPWYVNGTLDEREMDEVSEHVAQCTECTDEIRREVQLARALRSEPTGLDALLARQGDNLRQLQARIHRPGNRWRRGTRLMIRQPPLLAACAVLLVLGIGAGLLLAGAPQRSGYELLTNPPVSGAPVVQVIFHAEAREQDLRALLLDSGGRMLGNPSARGVYRIALPADSDAVVYARRLHGHPAVRWAEAEL